MARRKRRGGRRGFRVGKYVNLAFKGLGTLVALSPSFRGARQMASGDFEGGAVSIVYDYTGFVTTSGAFSVQKAAQGLGTVLAGVLLGRLGGYLGRRM